MIQSSFLPDWYTGGPSSSCEMIILRSKSHGEIISVCMGIFTTTFRNKTNSQILTIPHYTSPYFHIASLVIWPLTMLKGTHLSKLSISRFITYIREALLLWWLLLLTAGAWAACGLVTVPLPMIVNWWLRAQREIRDNHQSDHRYFKERSNSLNHCIINKNSNINNN